jgi:hypothetical protein
MTNCKGFGRKRAWPDFKVLSRHSPGGSEENYENRQDSLSAGRDLNPEPPKYVAGVGFVWEDDVELDWAGRTNGKDEKTVH